MTTKEQLREQFTDIVNSALYGGDPRRRGDCDYITDDLLEAAAEFYPKPYHITITPTDNQIRELADSLRGYYKAVFAYGCTCGAVKNSQPQQYEGT